MREWKEGAGRRWGFVSLWMLPVFVLKSQLVLSDCACFRHTIFTHSRWIVRGLCRYVLESITRTCLESFLCSHHALNMALRCCDQLGALMSLLLPRLEYVQQMVPITLFVFIQALHWVVTLEAEGSWIMPNMTFWHCKCANEFSLDPWIILHSTVQTATGWKANMPFYTFRMGSNEKKNLFT